MKLIKNIDDVPRGLSSVVSVGTFDGVHKAHQAIIKQMTDIAKKNKLVSVILTFDPHPRFALKMDDDKLKLLSTTEEKIGQMADSGIDYVVVINFTSEFAKIPYEEFIKKYLVDALGAKQIVVGFDHRFGKNRSGNYQALIDAKIKFGFTVVEIEALNENNLVISSTIIRNLLESHQLDEANNMLNYTYSLSGKVVAGTKTGKKLGFPTANISIDDPHKLIPAIGVYAVKVKVDNEFYFGMCNIGFKPTFENQPLTIETNIFNFDKDIYGKTIRIYFVSFVRNEKKFESASLLKLQLEIDKQNIIKKNRE